MTTDVQRTLDFIESNYSTYTSEPQPILYNADDGYRRDTGATTDEIRYREGNIIEADSAPPVDNEALGTEYDHRKTAGVGIEVKGLHERHGGHITPNSNQRASDYFKNDIVQAVLDALLAERTWPYKNTNGDLHWHSLKIDREENNSSAERGYYKYEFTVTYIGWRDLP